MLIKVHGRNGTFKLNMVNTYGTEASIFIDFFARNSKGTNPPCWLEGSKKDLLTLLAGLTKEVETIQDKEDSSWASLAGVYRLGAPTP